MLPAAASKPLAELKANKTLALCAEPEELKILARAPLVKLFTPNIGTDILMVKGLV